MRLQLKILMITGTLIAAALGAAAPAAAATAPNTMDTSTFACSNGVCEVGPGNVGTPFGAGLNVKIGTRCREHRPARWAQPPTWTRP